MSLSLNRERIAEIISGLVKAYCRKYDLLYFPRGSATDKGLARMYAHQESSGGVSDLEKYKYLEVPEAWIWQNKKIEFYQLVNSNYTAIAVSDCLLELSSEFLIEFINRGLEESPLIIEADFIEQLN